MKAKVLVIGGAEVQSGKKDLFSDISILERFVSETRVKKRSRIEILTSASSVPEEMGRDYIKAFHKLGADNCGFLNVENRSQADDSAILKRLKDCDALLATGGDQLALTSQ